MNMVCQLDITIVKLEEMGVKVGRYGMRPTHSKITKVSTCNYVGMNLDKESNILIHILLRLIQLDRLTTLFWWYN